MRLTIRVKLNPTAEQALALRSTLILCNSIANEVSQYAHDTGIKRKIDLQKVQYTHCKTRGLAAQASVRVIAKVADAYKTQAGLIRNGVLKGKREKKATSKPISFRPGAAQAFDDRNLSFDTKVHTISIWTTSGRLKSIPYVCSPEQARLIHEYRKGESDLLEQDGSLYLLVGVEVPEKPLRVIQDYLGFDSGIVNIATTSDGDNWSGGAVTLRRKKNRALRATLQAKGTKSAKRLLKKRSKKESRFARDVNHQVSKQIVRLAERTARGIAHEDLKGIRERVRLNKPARTELHSWAFAQLFSMVQYKAKRAGVPVRIVNPAYSSQLCPECGTIGRENRSSRDWFSCASCDHAGPADVVAARNIRSFALALE